MATNFFGGLAPWYWNTLGTQYTTEWRIETHKVEIIDMSNMSPEDAKKRIFGSITSEEFDNQTY